MIQHKVDPIPLPTLEIIRGKKRVAFVPSALWIIGADGRINVTANASQFILVDRRNDREQPSRWEIVLGKNRLETVPFTKEVLLDFLGCQS
jgi:hypothetical protein